MSKKAGVTAGKKSNEKIIKFPSKTSAKADNILWIIALYDCGQEKCSCDWDEERRMWSVKINAHSIERAAEIRNKAAADLGLIL